MTNNAKVNKLKKARDKFPNDGIFLYGFEKLEKFLKPEFEYEQAFFDSWLDSVMKDILASIWREKYNEKMNSKAADNAEKQVVQFLGF